MTDEQTSSIKVTNIPGTFQSGRESIGFIMNGYMVSNLIGIPDYLKKDWDVVAIVSGHGKVRVGKSTYAFQVATLIAWLLAGGKLELKQIKDEYGKTRFIKVVEQNPKKPIRFNLKENVVFSAMDLKNKAHQLYNKYGKNQIIIYDEAREGLEGARAMENLNKVMQDFFQECGFMGHVILLVLPNYFKLHEDYSVSRSIFLIDCLHDKHKKRGFFNFYNESDKEWLYFLGKKKLGITQKYKAARPTFYGRFSSWFPFDRVEYNALKEEALKKRAKSRREVLYKKQRDAIFYALYKDLSVSPEKMSDVVEDLIDQKISPESIEDAIHAIENKVKNQEELGNFRTTDLNYIFKLPRNIKKWRRSRKTED